MNIIKEDSLKALIHDKIRFLSRNGGDCLKDEYGRVNNKAQVIRNLDKTRMAYLFNDMKSNPEKYPRSIEEWYEWLEKSSGDSITTL